MNGDNPVQGKLDDISGMKDKCRFYDNDSAAFILHNNYSFSNSQTAAVLIFFTYLLLNTLILTLTVLYLGKMFIWIEQPQHKYLKDLYKASAIVLTFINLATFGSDILLHILFGSYFTYQVLIVKLFLVILIFILDIIVSCFYTFKYGQKWKIMHALALCQSVWFVHRLATDTIISIIAFVIAPAQTLGRLNYPPFIYNRLCSTFCIFLASKVSGMLHFKVKVYM